MAREHDVAVLQPESTRGEAFAAELSAHGPEVLMVASYGEILRQPILELAPHGALNVHGSLLPRWRGAAPIQRAILEGDETTGVAVQRIVLALDEGDVLLVRETPIGAQETSGDLFARLAELGGEAAVAALDELESGTATFTPQSEEGVTYAKKLTKKDGTIDWSKTAVELERFVRAMTPWPGARTRLANGRELGVLEARLIESQSVSGVPGTLSVANGEMRVATGEGELLLLQVKPEGKRPMEGSAFLRGARLEDGQVLGAGDAA